MLKQCDADYMKYLEEESSRFIAEGTPKDAVQMCIRDSHKRLKKEVVVKQIKNQGMALKEKRKEVDILKNLNHSYLPQVLDLSLIHI